MEIRNVDIAFACWNKIFNFFLSCLLLQLESLDLDTSSKSEMTVSCSSSLIANFKLDDDFDSETRDLFVMVDNPEKHTGTMESYITFRINTKVIFFFFWKEWRFLFYFFF